MKILTHSVCFYKHSFRGLLPWLLPSFFNNIENGILSFTTSEHAVFLSMHLTEVLEELLLITDAVAQSITIPVLSLSL